MLQVLLEPNERYSIPEQAQMAIEGGATWLILRCEPLEEAQIREVASDLVPLCRENGTILTFEGDPLMARELGVHGLLLHFHDDPVAVRAQVGPEAIIGVMSEIPDRIVAYDKADIDYAAMTLRNPAPVVEAVRARGCLMPFVAYGDYGLDDAASLKALGYDGVCTGRRIFEADDPVDYVRSFLAVLRK